ncbi:hypothetical protein POM88_013960 [Heracleum sosnowskyi]|uniref:Uncharacterized protein n=1 Tax=Heracleum sosnowskyi TaxID=360622 RepID=A0AAD8J144_9APIA|nr:hypothetical protein POM88_013960 [Heracleum sosnowskyi]
MLQLRSFQTKWWFAKRFLHPDIVAAYEYIFIWDEDLGVEHFKAEEYIKLVKKHGLEISQPGLEPNRGLTWQMTKRRGDREVHKETQEKPGWCPDSHLPPCAGFVEIMAPVFSQEAWRCVWHMIQVRNIANSTNSGECYRCLISFCNLHPLQSASTEICDLIVSVTLALGYTRLIFATLGLLLSGGISFIVNKHVELRFVSSDNFLYQFQRLTM